MHSPHRGNHLTAHARLSASRLRSLEDDNRQLNQLLSSFAEDVHNIKSSLSQPVCIEIIPNSLSKLASRMKQEDLGDNPLLNGHSLLNPKSHQLNQTLSSLPTHHLRNPSTRFHISAQIQHPARPLPFNQSRPPQISNVKPPHRSPLRRNRLILVNYSKHNDRRVLTT